MTPREARTKEELAQLKVERVEADDFRLSVWSGSVTIGHANGMSTLIPRDLFDAMIDWYNTGKFKKPRKRKPARAAFHDETGEGELG